ncbi:protease [Bdellovibrio bacteriovorus]|uniref:Protease n=1 Tax=Bdellovibrio bacteriovorus TaxID=959 RepID=A0A1Z3NBB5_BDEBC|nr:protease [Bdellovibrio bacteriovorus]ASD64725.1 protease [Bdellovibrio bacteriovorus]
MKLKFLGAALVALAMSLTVHADEFDGGSPDYDPRPNPHYTEAEIQRKIENEMAVACRGNLCSIVGTDGHGEGWTVSFQVGYGDNPNSGGNNFYIGDSQNSTNNGGDYYAGITVTYKNYSCNSTLRVTPSVYRFVNTYMYNMVNADGSTKRNFSPADQTVILFYTTMLNKVDNCKALN